MKNKFFLLFTAFVLTLTVCFGNSDRNGVPSAISNSFTRHFSGAKNVNWEQVGSLYKASFEMSGGRLSVYYSGDAHFIAVVHHILSDRLPLLLQAELKEGYKGYWISDLLEFVKHHESGYTITLENADEKIILKSDNLNNWDFYKKIPKD